MQTGLRTSSVESHFPSIHAAFLPALVTTIPLQSGVIPMVSASKDLKSVRRDDARTHETAFLPPPPHPASLKVNVQWSPVVTFLISIFPMISTYFVPATRLRT